jgi:ornithine carbamoyltransferase
VPKDLHRIADLTGEQVRQVLDVAGALAHHPGEMQRERAGDLVVLYLTEASTRTRVTFAHAAARVGATVVVVGPAELARLGGTLDDFAQAISGYAGAIVARTGDADLEHLAATASVPVINGRSDRHQPVQALADLLTLRTTFDTLDDLRVAYIGDGTSVCHSLIEACALTGIDLRLVCPPGRAPDAEVLARAGALPARVGTGKGDPNNSRLSSPAAPARWSSDAVSQGLRLRAQPSGPTLTYDAAEAVDGVDALYLGPWLAGALPDDESTAVPSYPVTRDLLDRAAPHMLLASGYPFAFGSGLRRDQTPRAAVQPGEGRRQRRQGDAGAQTVVLEVLRDPRYRGREQAENRRHVAAALLVALCRDEVEAPPARVLTSA